MSFARVAACAVALVLWSAAAAQALPALANKTVNLRQGPGTSYRVIATIPGGSTVELGGCRGDWCAVAWRGRNGYVVVTSLDQGGRSAEGPPAAAGPPPGMQPAYPPPPGYYPPRYYYDPYYAYGPYYGYGPYWRRRWW